MRHGRMEGRGTTFSHQASKRGGRMGQPVVHFEVTGKDGAKLRSYYSELFDWDIDSNNDMGYGVVQRDGNTNADGAGIGGGIAQGPGGDESHATFSVHGPDAGGALAQAERPGGSRMMG